MQGQPLDRLFRVLPDMPELAVLRQAILGASQPDPEKQWSSASAYATFDKRVLPASALSDVVAAARAAAGARIVRLYDAAAFLLQAAAEGEDAAAAVRLIELGEEAEAVEDLTNAAACYGVAVMLAAPLPDRQPLILALRRHARVRVACGELPQALQLYRSSLEQAAAVGAVEDQAIALTGTGNVFSLQSEWPPARQAYQHALELTADSEVRLRAQLQVNLAVVAREEERFDDARSRLAEAHAAWEHLEAQDRAAWHNCAGLLAMSLGVFRDAERELTEALTLADGAGDRAMVLDNLAEVAIRRGHLATAETVARRAEKHALAASPRSLAEVYMRLARIFHLRGDANGVTFFEKALELCRTHAYPRLEAAACREYASFRSSLGDGEEARAYMERAAAILAGLNDGVA